MKDIRVEKVNEAWMKIHCAEIYMEMDLSDEFSFKVPGAKYDQRVRSGRWDGVKRLYNRKTKKLYAGLLFKLLEICEKKGWSYEIDDGLMPDVETLSTEDLERLIGFINPHAKNAPIVPHEHQIAAVQYMLNMGRSVCLAATSAGKSLIIYLCIRIYQLLEIRPEKIFIIVPSKSLVEQMYDDFEDYSTFDESNWHVSAHCQKVSSGYSKFIEKNIVITTWQSMSKMQIDVYDNIGAVFVDETHTAQAAVLSKILENCRVTKFRHGLTGTLDNSECNQLVIQGLLGPAKKIVSAKELIDKGHASKLKIDMCILSHAKETCVEINEQKSKLLPKNRYVKEVDCLANLRKRTEFMFNMFEAVEGNTLILFDKVENYGKPLYEEYAAKHENVFLVTGEVDGTERNEIKKLIEQHDNAVIFASYGVFQQGISIKNLHNLFLISSSKSVIRVLQSLGRMMRLHKSKDCARVYDIVDDLTADGSETNYMMAHAAERIRFYYEEQHELEFTKFKI